MVNRATRSGRHRRVVGSSREPERTGRGQWLRRGRRPDSPKRGPAWTPGQRALGHGRDWTRTRRALPPVPDLSQDDLRSLSHRRSGPGVRLTVNQPALPTLVRIQHLPRIGKTARDLRKLRSRAVSRGPAVTGGIRACTAIFPTCSRECAARPVRIRCRRYAARGSRGPSTSTENPPRSWIATSVTF